MDELGSYAVQSLARPFEQGRSAQMALFPAAQTLANLDVVSPDFKEMVIGNTWTKIFFKIGTQATAVECADLIGMKIGVTKSLSGTQNEQQHAASQCGTRGWHRGRRGHVDRRA